MVRTAAVNILTLGCKANAYDSVAMQHQLNNSLELRPAKGNQEATIYIVNTCSVTEKSEREARQLIYRLRRQHPHTKIIVTGCYAQSNPESLANLAEVDHVWGNAEKHHIAELLKGLDSASPKIQVSPIRKHRTIFYEHINSFSNRTRAFLKVQDGCNNFCTFCIIPSTRGVSRSVPLKDIAKQLRQLSEANYPEVVITGIDLGSYGRDLKPRSSLFALLKYIAELALPMRIRLSSLDPEDFTPELVQLISKKPSFANHLHLPLQSGDNEILQSMRRSYTIEKFFAAVALLRKNLPNCGLGTDLITGFPGETDTHFNNTCDIIQSLPFTYLHVFPFSPKRGTKAADFPQRPSIEVAKRRCQVLRKIGEDKKRAFMESQIGKKLEVLIETRRDSAIDYVIGYSSNYVPCCVPAKVEPGTFVSVIGQQVRNGFLETSLVS